MCGRNRWLAYVLGALAALGASGAHADGGRLTFTGHIVEATCPVGPDSPSDADARVAAGRINCGSSGGHPRSYDMTRTVLTGNEPDRVLRYFNEYVRAGYAASQPTLVVRVYE